MSIKIDGNRPTMDTEATEAARKAGNEKRVQTGQTNSTRPAAAGPDRVEVSSDAKLLSEALAAAKDTPELRTELIERMKQKLNAGELGTDSRKLADRLIDDLLNK